jgi:hypothetical protein
MRNFSFRLADKPISLSNVFNPTFRPIPIAIIKNVVRTIGALNKIAMPLTNFSVFILFPVILRCNIFINELSTMKCLYN